MKKTKILSLLLGLSLLCTLIVPATVYADDPTADSGMKISKTATANDDGSYTITLEAFATGSKTTTVQTEDIPTDIILVLDQSGSMADDIGTVSFKQYKDEDERFGNITYHTRNQDYYEYRHNGGSANLWHKLPDGSYVSVSVKKTTTYKELNTKLPNYDYRNECYWDYANNLYEKVGDKYKKVGLEHKFVVSEGIRYTYTFADNSTIQSFGVDTIPDLGSHAPLYTPVEHGNDTVYTYTYTDATGAEKTIGTSIGANTQFTPAFYRRSTSTSGGGSRLNALKSAANAFASAVATKAAGEDGDITTTADNIDHRIAVVGYADTDWDYGYNTGVFIGSTLNRYENNAAGVYGTALQDMSTTNGKSNVAASLNALKASGATRTDYGLTMANGILNANPVPTGETRNRVVIVFTDGSPTNSNGFQRAVANSAISTANAIKAGGTTVYSIGIFSGADASTAGKEPDEDYYEDSWGRTNYTDAEMSAACNWFMQKVSSNNGTPRTPGYYLSAGDSASLNSIFQQISNNITTGGSATTLGSETVVKDIISPYFTLPAGTTASNIQINTYDCTGKNGDTYTWSSTSGGNGGATATVNGDQVSVTGFDFSKNWCGTETDTQGATTVRGKKLVISFTVDPKSGFLGGNDVITNASAGVYENSSAQTPVMTFEQPKVNVPIKDVTVTATDKNVYLLGDVTADQLKDGATVKVGEVELNLSKDNYGLEDWQTKYVEIKVEVKDAKGNVISDKLDNLTEDTTYTVEVTVAPKTAASTDSAGTPATTKTSPNTLANINVFTPELTFKDSQINLGETADYENNKATTNFEVWKHQDAVADPTTMIGTKPTLVPEYSPVAAAFTRDTPVKVTVKISNNDVTGHTKFVHENCTFEGCKWNDLYAEEKSEHGNAHFIVHVKSFDLTIKKTGTQPIDENQSFVFKVTKDDDPAFSMDVVIQGNSSVTIKDLKPGTYTVTEETGWSWRYTPNANGKKVEPKNAENGVVTVTFDNERKNDKWLNGGAWCKNLWGTSTPIKSN